MSRLAGNTHSPPINRQQSSNSGNVHSPTASGTSSNFSRSPIPKSRNCAVYCDCNLPTSLKTSWKDPNYGRRFLGCPDYDSELSGCKFFEWYDDELSSRAKSIISGLLKKLDRYEATIADLGDRYTTSEHVTAELKRRELEYCIAIRDMATRDFELSYRVDVLAKRQRICCFAVAICVTIILCLLRGCVSTHRPERRVPALYP